MGAGGRTFEPCHPDFCEIIMRRLWSIDEINLLKKQYSTIPIDDIASAVNRSSESVRRQAFRLGLHREVTREQSGDANPNWKGGISKQHYRYKLIQKERYPDRVRARQLVNDEIKARRMTRGKCKVCGSDNAHAHHEDYSKPLDVEWFCRKHHRELHDGTH